MGEAEEGRDPWNQPLSWVLSARLSCAQDPEAEEEEEEGEPPVAPSPPPSRARGHEVHEQLSQMQGTGEGQARLPVCLACPVPPSPQTL